MKKIFPFLSFLFLYSLYSFVFGAMTSPNYKINFDSINIGGEDFSTSASNYRLKDTMGEVGAGLSQSDLYRLFAGYRQMDEVYIALSVSTSSFYLLPALSGITGGTSNGSTTITVVTDSPSGFSLLVQATNSPAMICAETSCQNDYFSDYSPQNPSVPDFNWNIPNASSAFGFTPEGSFIVQKFKDNGTACNAGSLDTQDHCWYYFSTSPEYISQSYSPQFPTGAQTILKLRAQITPNRAQKSGIYQATIIITAFSN